MKKAIAIILSIMLAISITLPAAATSTKAVKKTRRPNAQLEVKLQNPKVSIIWMSTTDKDMNNVIQGFQKACSAKVKVTLATWTEWETKTISMMAAGIPPDATYIQYFPKYAIKNMVQPLDPYFNLKDPLFNKSGLEAYSWKGKHYALLTDMDMYPTMITYNKTMFVNNGLETPLSLFNKGKWNFTTFREAAMALTQDTNGDGNIDQWGYANCDPAVFITANGGSFVSFNKNGSIKLTMNDPKLLRAVKFVQDGFYKDKYTPLDNVTVATGNDFNDGKVAMNTSWNFQPLKFKWDQVPVPIGPDNKTGQLFGTASGFGITKGAKNPVGAAAFIYCYEKYYISHFNSYYSGLGFNKEQIARLRNATKKVTVAYHNGIGNWYNLQWPMWGDIYAGKSISSTFAKYKPIFQKEIDLTLADIKLPKVKPFKGAPVIDFENGIGDVDLSKNYGVVSAAITNDAAEVISGTSSLKIDAKNDAGWQKLFQTSATTIQLPSFHVYKISFDYKALGDTGADGYYYLRGCDSGGGSYGWNTLGPLKAGDKGNYEFTVAFDKNSTNSIECGGYNVGGIVIDNIKITE
jgi:maltose-binding protein MalE